MKTLTSDELVGLINSSQKFANLMKIAANGNTGFNEDVPATMGGAPGGAGSGYPPNSAPAGQVPPPVQPEEGGEYAAVPEEEMGAEAAPQGPSSPEDFGVLAAQNFMAPFMEAAMAGDPNAQKMVAQAAGNIAGSVSESYMRAAAGAAPAGPAGAPMAPAVPTPEEDLANQIAGDQQPPEQPPQEGEEEENGAQPKNSGNGKKKPPFPPKK